MEITFEKKFQYSMNLSKGSLTRELADHLDITVKEMRRLVDKGTLYELHEEAILQWLENKSGSWDEQSSDEIEVDQVTW